MKEKVLLILLSFTVSFFMCGMDRNITFVKSIEDAYEVLHATPVDPSFISNGGSYLKVAGPYFLGNPDCIDKKDQIVSCEITFNIRDTMLDLTLLLEHMPSLTALSINNMPITQIKLPQETMYASINHFELSGTNITQFDCEEVLRTFPHIKSLFIKNNKKLTTIIYPINYLQHLEEIDLRNNGLKTIDLNKLLLVSARLKYINVSDNPLESIEWQPDDFVAHHKAPDVILKNVALAEDEKNTLLKYSTDDNKIYLWMKKFVPIACALYFAHSNHDNLFVLGFKKKLMGCSIGAASGYILGMFLVNTILFPKQEDKQLPYFKPVFA